MYVATVLNMEGAQFTGNTKMVAYVKENIGILLSIIIIHIVVQL